MKIVSENVLKERMLDYFREVEATGEELLVTKDGEMVLKIISYQRELGTTDSNANEHGPSL